MTAGRQEEKKTRGERSILNPRLGWDNTSKLTMLAVRKTIVVWEFHFPGKPVCQICCNCIGPVKTGTFHTVDRGAKLFFTRPLPPKGCVCFSTCPSSLFPFPNIEKFDGLHPVNHIFSESISHWQPLTPCSNPVPTSNAVYWLSTTKYQPIPYSMDP